MHSRIISDEDESKRLKRARQQAGLDQRELAEKLGTDQSTISRIESGQKPRKILRSAISEFINQQEADESVMIARILNQLKSSKEFRQLINRIVQEL